MVALLSLALGIGANTAIFSAVNSLLLRPLPVEKPEQIISLNGASKNDVPIFSYLNYGDLRDRNEVLDGMIAYRMAPVSLSYDGINERAWGYVATGNYFDVLGVKPARGRFFTQEDDKAPGAHPVMVITYNCWQKRFAGDPNIVGRNVMVNARRFTIIGVAPQRFYGTEVGYVAEMWFPMMMLAQIIPWSNDLYDRSGQSYMVQGRLKPWVSIAQAEASLKAVAAQLVHEYPNDNRGLSIMLSPPGLFGSYGRRPVMAFLGVLMTASGLVLLLACINLATLLLSRATERRKEIAIRLAIGAGRLRLVRQLLTESVLLALLGGAFGLLLAYWIVDTMRAFNPPLDIPLSSDLQIDYRVLFFTLAVSLVTGVVFGLLPALQSTRPDLVPALKDDLSGGGYRRSLLRDGLVVFQVTLSLVLLIGAGLVLRSLLRVQLLNPGFEPKNAIEMSFDLGLQGYDGARSRIFKQQLLDRVRALPGVQYAGLADYVPFDMLTRTSNIHAEGQPQERNANPPSALRGSASPGFLQSLGARLLQGRDFTEQDNETKQRVGIINETFARRVWKGQTAVGKRFSYHGQEGPWIEVIGVIQDGKYFSLSDEGTLFAYTNLEHDNSGNGLNLILVARTANDPQSVIAAIRREIGQLDRNLPVFNVKTMGEQLNGPLFPARVAATLLGSFGLLALTLSAIGIFGVMSYAVSQRRREIGIRMALGANSAQIFKAIVGRGLLLTAIGSVLGLLLASLGTRLMSSLLYGVSALDPLIFACVSLLLAIVAFLACYFPAREAMRIDPITALRYE